MANGSFEVSPGTFMEASCHHRPGSRTGRHLSACGACYARLVQALERIEKAPTIEEVQAICAETNAAMKADRPRAEAPRG